MWGNHVKSMMHHITGIKGELGNFKIVNCKKLGTFHFVQEDDYNCGPIVCATMWYLMCNYNERETFAHDTGLESIGDLNLRKVIVGKMKLLLKSHKCEMFGFSKFKDLAQTTDNLQFQDETFPGGIRSLCNICIGAIIKGGEVKIVMKCGHGFHEECINR